MFTSARDITEQARLEAELSGERAYNRALVEASAEAFFAVDPDGVVTDVNALACELTGHSRQRLIGHPFAALFRDFETARRVVREAFATSQVTDYELIIDHERGDVTVSVNAGVYRDSAGQVHGVFAAARDITTHKQMRRELRAQQRYVRSLFESAMDPLFTTDVTGRIIDVNAAMQKLAWGATRQRLVGAHLAEIAAEPEKARYLISRALRDGWVADVEFFVPQPDGESIVLSCNASTFTDGQGRLAGILIAARDVTERKRLQETQQHLLEQAQELDQAKSDLVSRVSHELRSPLTGVVGYLELLRAGRAGPLSEEQQRVAGLIAEHTERLRAQIEDLLTMSRIEANKLVLNMERTDLAEIARSVGKRLKPMLRAGRLRFHLNAGTPAVVDGDPLQLERVVANLISNAIKFTPEEGRIDVSVATDNGDAVLRVHDTGIGVPTEEQPRLFTRFFRSSASEAAQTTGTGLGLFIVRQVAEAHGGAVSAESALGEGSTFTVRLPEASGEDTHPEDEEMSPDGRSGRG